MVSRSVRSRVKLVLAILATTSSREGNLRVSVTVRLPR